MADKPSVLFMSCSDTQPDEIIRLVLNVEELPQEIKIDEDIHGFSWEIDNKYYHAEVYLCSLKKKSIGSKRFADSVEAVILHFDSSKNDSLGKVESWLPFVNEYHPEIKILLCKNVSSENCDKRNIQEWCLRKGFELIELEPVIENDNTELEDDFFETTGIKRIVQALNAHVWPNLVMKTSNTDRRNSYTPAVNFENGFHNHKQHSVLDESLEELLENDDSFSQLFSQLSEMKARVSSLSGEDRKVAAEQVVRAFWKALTKDEEDDDDLLNI